MTMVTNVNLTIRGLNDRVYRRFKAKAVEEGIRIGDAVNQAMELWIRETNKRPGSKLIDIESFNWGRGTERTSSEIDELLYGGRK